jgi:hypothetical protein
MQHVGTFRRFGIALGLCSDPRIDAAEFARRMLDQDFYELRVINGQPCMLPRHTTAIARLLQPARAEKRLPVAPVAAPVVAAIARAPVQETSSGVVAVVANTAPDADGWIRIGQRKLAQAAGVSVTKAARDLREAQKAGLLQIDTSGTMTAVRVLNS